MTTLTWPTKDPDEVLDYSVDWSKRMPSTDAVVVSVWTVPGGLTNVDQTIAADAKSSAVWLSGGVLDVTYLVLGTVTTAQGRTLQQTVKIKVKAR